jgi:acetyl-CoA acetyltransferase
MKKALTIDLASVFWPVMSRDIEINPEYGYTEDTMTLVEILSRVVLYNDDHHTFDEVIDQVIKATACSGERAESIAWEVHTRGQAMVFEGELFDCLRVSSVLEEIALHTQVLT